MAFFRQSNETFIGKARAQGSNVERDDLLTSPLHSNTVNSGTQYDFPIFRQ